MRTALITGITGQDGGYLARHLLASGWKVLGTTRNLRDQLVLPDIPGAVTLIDWDMRDARAMAAALSQYKPSAIYNLAARSSGAGMFDEPVETSEDNGIAVTCLLEAIRMTDSAIRFCQASSSEMFGRVEDGMQTERTAFRPRSPYGAAKLYAHTMVDIYRRHHGLFACSAILYNHESPRRSEDFVTGKIARGVARIRLGLSGGLKLGNLNARRDWGYAPDYMEAMYLMLEQPAADDYVIATGETHAVREFCDIAFRHVGLDYRDHVSDDPAGHRRAAEMPLCGDAGKALRVLGWRPRTQFADMVRLMVDDALRFYATTDSVQTGQERDAR
ncbi:GDP-mannose 4,6-dehydratase [Rhodanobacter sp. C05]|uniref:GDP-mannose 4,6-dehydratase n=1 Tax=Rhodanobacter sp. C05 TaxID=1945855 RepID=UPI000987C05B|nr:GDP-mannose 4,6-dehydratase [Rhodanobacter sp. C05]OOG42478.1 GDP-mannose 4,6-dehydratase [Rhodanobacter sp. C05]